MNPEFGHFLEESCFALAKEVPEFPTQMGLFEVAGKPVPQHYFTSIDSDAVTQRQELLAGMGTTLTQFPRETLDASEKLSADLLGFLVTHIHERGLMGTAGKDFLQHEYLIRPSVGLQSELPLFLTNLHPMRHPGDAEDFLSRLKSIASLLDAATTQIQMRQVAGLLPPALVLRDSIEEIEQFLATPPSENVILSTLIEKTAGMAGLDQSTRDVLLAETTTELSGQTYPVYRQLLSRLRKQVPMAEEAPGVWRLPDGDAWYDFQLKCATTLSLTADEVHDIGLEETHRLEQKIIAASREVGIDARNIGDCHQALDSGRMTALDDTEANRDAIVDEIKTLMAEIVPRLPELFHRLPMGQVTVKAIPRFAEANRNQSYQPPSMDGSRAGFFELNVGQLLEESEFELPILVYHEIFPGHHLQMARAQETEGLPSLRRIITFDAYIEGWAKYAETLPELHHINQDPYFRIARMRRELISTINLVLDTGIHAKRWSTEQATHYFSEHSGKDQAFSRFIVHRSASVPAQLCSYKLGMMKMQNLRSKMEAALGASFDVRDFHEAVLGSGAVPLALLEPLVNQAIGRILDKA
ncbi:MAG TPA: DUF885 domain-containing protein [Xanthomonadales bacterium]|nr:DUF885 domain-containing protein [Xanthomonadales bacterium]